MPSNPKQILVIAGSDSCGGAGIQADIKTAAAHHVFAATAITCLTAQNSRGVFAIQNAEKDFLTKQIEVLFNDMQFDAIKIGMLGNAEIIDVVANILSKKAKNIPLILDTVMVATSGDLLLETNAIDALREKLINGCEIVTPNIDEAQILAGMKITGIKEMKEAARIIQKIGAKNVLIKGGHLDFSDNRIRTILLNNKGEFSLITNKKIGTQSLHGTGCTLASAIACNVAQNMNLLQAVRKANHYVYRSILKSAQLGKGSRILRHF